MELERKIQDVFVLPLTIQREDRSTLFCLVFAAAVLGFCSAATFIEISMPLRASLTVLSVKNATLVTSL